MEEIKDYKENESSMVLSSRVRLARNLSKIPFPVKLDEERSNDIIEKVFNSCDEDEKLKDLRKVRLIENSPQSIGCFFEKHLISKELIEGFNKTAFLVNNDENTSVLINDEDHIRIQSFTRGLDLKSPFVRCCRLDDELEKTLTYAFDENLGYLTANPRNVGTGLRGSVIIHIPAIAQLNQFEKVKGHLNDFGMIIKPVYGDKDKCIGDFYQISSEVTIGMTEEDILIDLEEEVFKVMTKESALRRYLLNKNEYEILDKIHRAYAILKDARIISLQESLELLSNVRLGVEMSIIKNVDLELLDDMIIKTQPNNVKMLFNRENLSDKEVNIKRAEIMRNALSLN